MPSIPIPRYLDFDGRISGAPLRRVGIMALVLRHLRMAAQACYTCRGQNRRGNDMEFVTEAFDAFIKYAPALGVVITIAMLARRVETKADAQKRFGQLTERMDNQDNRLDRIEGRLDKQQASIDEIRNSQAEQYVDLNRNITGLRGPVAALESDVGALKQQTNRIERDMEATRNLVEARVLGVPVAPPDPR